MIIFRPIRSSDEEQFIELTQLVTTGITTLPKDPLRLRKKIEQSESSFKKITAIPESGTKSKVEKEHYIFVVEDTESKSVIGTSAITAVTGDDEPLYFYRIEKSIAQSNLKEVPAEIPYLAPISYVRGPSEICSLFLHPDYRKSGIGKLLSLARFLFIATFRSRFTNSIFAELRGINYNDISPFWNGVGRHFLNVSFTEALHMLSLGKKFIPEFLPKHPIYIPLLSPEVQNSIGKTHENTKAALSILLREGFEYTDEVDIFDAGPKIRAMTDSIRTVRLSKKCPVKEIRHEIDNEKLYIISNERLEFSAVLGKVIFSEKGVSIDSKTQEALKIELKDSVRLVEI